MADTPTHQELIDMIGARHAPPEWAFLRNVANMTGYGANRAADGIALGLWPSRGLELRGFEAKTSRADWLRELKDPAKADAISAYCDTWWIVAADNDIVKEGELPHAWGLMLPGKSGLRQVKAATSLAVVRTTKLVDRPFLAAVLRRSTEQSNDTPEHIKALREAYAKGFSDAIVRRKAGELTDEMKRLLTQFTMEQRSRVQRLQQSIAYMVENDEKREVRVAKHGEDDI